VSPTPEQLAAWVELGAEEASPTIPTDVSLETDAHAQLGWVLPLMVLLLAVLYAVSGPAVLVPIILCLSLLLATAWQ
jgi:hypothetical protein